MSHCLPCVNPPVNLSDPPVRPVSGDAPAPAMSAAADPKGAETAVQKSLMFLLQYITILLTGQGSFSCFSKFFSVFFRQNRLFEPLPLMKRPAGCFSSRPTRRRAAKERQNRAGFPWTDRAAAPTARVIRKGCAWQNRTAFRSPGLCICTRRTLPVQAARETVDADFSICMRRNFRPVHPYGFQPRRMHNVPANGMPRALYHIAMVCTHCMPVWQMARCRGCFPVPPHTSWKADRRCAGVLTKKKEEEQEKAFLRIRTECSGLPPRCCRSLIAATAALLRNRAGYIGLPPRYRRTLIAAATAFFRGRQADSGDLRRRFEHRGFTTGRSARLDLFLPFRALLFPFPACFT